MEIEQLILTAIDSELLAEKVAALLSPKILSLIEAKKPDRIFTRKEAAKYLSTSLVNLHALVNKGLLAAHKLEGRTYFLESELLETIKKL